MNSAGYLDALRARLNLPSDGRAAERIGASRARVSNWRRGVREMDNDLIPKVAQLLDIDPVIVVADIAAARATSTFERDAFARLAAMARRDSAAESAASSAAEISDGGPCRTRTDNQGIMSPLL